MIQVKIGTVDMYGFCGRDKHPVETDSNRVGELVGFEKTETPGEDEELNMTGFLTVRFPDGREVELVEYEVHSITMR